jgi:hypothetical protein
MHWLNPNNDDHPPANKLVEGRWDLAGICGSVVRECIYIDATFGWRLVDPLESREVRAPDAWRYVHGGA